MRLKRAVRSMALVSASLGLLLLGLGNSQAASAPFAIGLPSSAAADGDVPSKDDVERESAVSFSEETRAAYDLPPEGSDGLWADRSESIAWKEAGMLLTDAEYSIVRRSNQFTLDRRPVLQKANELDGFSGSDYEPKSAHLTLYFKAISDEDKKELESAIPPEKGTVEVQVRPGFTRVELSNLATELYSELRSRSDSTMEGVTSSHRENALVVMVSEAGAKDTQSTAADFSKRHGVSVRVQLSEGADDACSSQAYCDSPQRGGVAITRQSPGSPCTSGFTVVYPSGNRMALTAGHCWYGYNSGTVYGSPTNSGASFGSLNSSNALYQGSTADARVVDTPNSTTQPWIYWVGGTEWVIRGKRDRLEISEGDRVCLRAYVQQSPMCANVSYVDSTFRVEACSCDVQDFMFAPYGRTGGNSGGPVVTDDGRVALGIHSGTNGGLGRFSPVSEAESRLGVSVLLGK